MEEIIEQFVKAEPEFGNGSGSGYGSGYGWGNGSGYGAGWGWGDGDGWGCGWGDGSGFYKGIKSFNKEKVYYIDGIPTIIRNVRDNIAQGFILQSDFTLTPCFVAKEGNTFAHGDTIHEAYEALLEKLFDNEPEEVRIEKFKEHFRDFSKKYPAKDLFHWHYILTGSCKAGRLSFCRDKGIDIEKDQFTIYEFIELTKDSYQGEIINKLNNK